MLQLKNGRFFIGDFSFALPYGAYLEGGPKDCGDYLQVADEARQISLSLYPECMNVEDWEEKSEDLLLFSESCEAVRLCINGLDGVQYQFSDRVSSYCEYYFTLPRPQGEYTVFTVKLVIRRDPARLRELCRHPFLQAVLQSMRFCEGE